MPSFFRIRAMLSFASLLAAGAAASPAQDFFDAMKVQRLAPPSPTHEFMLSTPDGKFVKLSDMRGKVVLLNFWATWCPACREEMPSMEQLYHEFKHRGLVMLAVNMQETREAVGTFVDAANLTFPVLLDEDGKVSTHYGIRFIPTTFLVGKDGTLIGQVIGPQDWASPAAYQLVGSLLGPIRRAETPAPAQPRTTLGSGNDEVRTFLARHWQFHIPPQGPVPAKFAPIEASLDPASCGACHPAQYADWRTSVHANAMGPGVMGQLVDMMRSDPFSALDCQRCHSPLAEQQKMRAVVDGQGQSVLTVNSTFDPGLRAKGLVCAACHVRQWERFGPPRRDGTLTSSTPREQLPHHGVTRTPAFLKSEFCMGCHQFTADGFKLNGKLLENTYEEWKASPYARQGMQCQNCHMPDRHHLWRGIHDPQMVSHGVTVDLKTEKTGDQVHATLTVTNSRVGHNFPTYLTPKVFLTIELADARGRQIEGSFRQAVIGREARLDLSREVYDTRLPPKASFRMKESWSNVGSGLRLRARVIVEPDHFYTKFFQATIQDAEFGRAELEEALRRAQRSSFTIFAREVAL